MSENETPWWHRDSATPRPENRRSHDGEAVRHARGPERVAAGALGAVLDRLPWDLYLSVWPRHRVRKAERATSLFRKRINGIIGGEYQTAPYAAAFAEPDPNTGNRHLHATISYPFDLSDKPLPEQERARSDLRKRLRDSFPGDAQVQRYRKAGGAAQYSSKRIGHADSDLWISPRARTVLSRQAADAESRSSLFRSFEERYGPKLPERRPETLSDAVNRNP